MSRPIALTPSERRYLRQVKAARRELVRQLKSLPSRSELAKLMNVSERTIARAMDDQPAKAAPRLTSLRELFA